MASKNNVKSLSRSWLRSHRDDNSLIDGVPVGELASELLMLREEVRVLRAAPPPQPAAAPAPVSVEAALQPPDAAEETDDEATAVYSALAYVHTHGLACLWLNREQRKAPLLSADTLLRLIEAHAARVKQAQEAAPDLPGDALGSALAAELFVKVRGSYHQALQPILDEANGIVEALLPFVHVGTTDRVGGWRVVAVTGSEAEAAAPSPPTSGEKAWDLGKPRGQAPALEYPPAVGEKAWDLGKKS